MNNLLDLLGQNRLDHVPLRPYFYLGFSGCIFEFFGVAAYRATTRSTKTVAYILRLQGRCGINCSIVERGRVLTLEVIHIFALTRLICLLKGVDLVLMFERECCLLAFIHWHGAVVERGRLKFDIVKLLLQLFHIVNYLLHHCHLPFVLNQLRGLLLLNQVVIFQDPLVLEDPIENVGIVSK